MSGQAQSRTRPVLVSVNGESYAEKPSMPTYLWTRSEPSRSTAAPYTSGQDTSASGSEVAQSPRDNLRRRETLCCGGVGGREEPPVQLRPVPLSVHGAESHGPFGAVHRFQLLLLGTQSRTVATLCWVISDGPV